MLLFNVKMFNSDLLKVIVDVNLNCGCGNNYYFCLLNKVYIIYRSIIEEFLLDVNIVTLLAEIPLKVVLKMFTCISWTIYEFELCKNQLNPSLFLLNNVGNNIQCVT